MLDVILVDFALIPCCVLYIYDPRKLIGGIIFKNCYVITYFYLSNYSIVLT